MKAVPATVAEGAAGQGRGLTLGELVAPVYLVGVLVVAFAPFETMLATPGSVSSVALPLLGVCALVLAPSRDLARIPVVFAVPAYAAWLGASIAWTESPVTTAFVLRSEVPNLVLVWLVAATMPPHRVVRVLVGLVLAVGSWSLVMSVIRPGSSAAVLADGVSVQDGWRGTFIHKNLLGIFMVIGLSVLLEYRVRGRRALLVGCLVVILGTRSATAASGAVAVVVTYGWLRAVASALRPRERAMLKVLSLAALVLSVLAVVGLLPSLVELYGKDLTFSGRTKIWGASLEAIGRQPLHGYGVGGVWADETDPLTVQLNRDIGFPVPHAHNGALNLLLEVGLIGLVLYATVVARTVGLAAGRLRTPDAAYGRWALTTVAAIALMALSEPLFRGPELLVVVIACSVLAQLERDQRAGSRRAGRGEGIEPAAGQRLP